MRAHKSPVRTDLAPTPLFSSLTRPILIGGVERELMIPLVTIVLMLLIQLTVTSWAAAVVVVTVVLPELRRRTARDPRLLAVLKGHLAVAGYYPAQGHPEQSSAQGPQTF